MPGDLGFTESDDDRFAANVRLLRERQGWSQTELAKRLRESGHEHFHATTISRIENGERGVRLSEARAISRVLGVDVSVMVEPPEDARAIQDFIEAWQEYVAARGRLATAALDFNDARAMLRHHLGAVEQFDPELGRVVGGTIETIEHALKETVESVVHDTQEHWYGGGNGVDPEEA